jgi:penicillin-binding protein-related factor A (putative recombinase)
MSKINRGKAFEQKIKEAFEKVHDVSIDRINDNMNGYKGIAGICDFTVYKYPYICYLECKSCYGTTLPFSNITNNQWNGMLEKSKIKGITAGVMVWFIDYDKTVFIPIQSLQQMKEKGDKSVNVKYLDNILNLIYINGVKKVVFIDYDVSNFFRNVERCLLNG